jgi:predicted transposase YdaD
MLSSRAFVQQKLGAFALAAGENLKAIEIAKNLKNLGLPFDQISKATSLTEEEIEKI